MIKLLINWLINQSRDLYSQLIVYDDDDDSTIVIGGNQTNGLVKVGVVLGYWHPCGNEGPHP